MVDVRSTQEAAGEGSEISSFEIVVVVRRDDEGDALARELLRTRSRVRRLWPMPMRLPEDADVIFCELVPELPQCLPWVPGEPLAALVAVTPAIQAPDLKLLRNCAPHAVLHRPFTPGTVLTSLALARAQFLYERRLRTRIDKLDETLRAFRSVERAKTILMQTRKLDEEEAYHFMRRQAMNRRISISAVAAAIVDSHDVLG
ncbi:MAG TPA: ANTAR domain-containing protein [Stellaceae bacterium]|nr:ANTAR domain-containing protein [Stellaceae bacterium]